MVETLLNMSPSFLNPVKQMKEQGEEIIALGNQISALRDENVRLKRELNSMVCTQRLIIWSSRVYQKPHMQKLPPGFRAKIWRMMNNRFDHILPVKLRLSTSVSTNLGSLWYDLISLLHCVWRSWDRTKNVHFSSHSQIAKQETRFIKLVWNWKVRIFS